MKVMRKYCRSITVTGLAGAGLLSIALVSLGSAYASGESVRSSAVDELRMVTRLERAGNVLLLHYIVENRSGRDAYLLNRVPDHSLKTNPDLIYIELNRDRRFIRAYKNIPAIPPGMNPTMPVCPYVTALRAGKQFTETVRISMPVHAYSAYAPAPGKSATTSFQGLKFALGYYWAIPGMKERTQEIVPGVKVLIPSPPPGKTLEFGELSSDLMMMDIPVID